MALKAGYVGVKRFFITKVNNMLATLNDIIPEGAADDNQLVTASDLTTGLAGKLSIGAELSNDNDLNDVKDTGLYCVTTMPANTPESKNYFTLLVNKRTSGDVKQIIFKDGTMYLRSYGGSTPTWTNWYKYTGTAVTPPTTQNSPAPDDDTRNIDPEIETKTTRKSIKKEDN